LTSSKGRCNPSRFHPIRASRHSRLLLDFLLSELVHIVGPCLRHRAPFGNELHAVVLTILLMKSAILPQVRVDPELRANLESMLRKGETLSEFIEGTVRSAAEYRRAQAEFYARGGAAWQEYSRTGMAHPTDQVIGEMRERLKTRRQQLGAPPVKAR